MKKLLKSVITMFIMVSILFTSFFPTYATDSENFFPDTSETNANNANTAMHEGKVTSTVGDDDTGEQQQTNDLTPSSSVFTFLMSVLMSTVAIIPQTISYLMTTTVTGGRDLTPDTFFTIQNCVSGQYDLFDFDVFELDPAEGPYKSFHSEIRHNIAIWYVALRNVALVLCAIIVIYIGLRMALATIAEQQAKYKKMLIGWVTSICLLFMLHYVILIFIYLAKQITLLVYKGMQNMQSTFSEQDLVDGIWGKIWSGSLSSRFLNFFLYIVLVWYQLKYFILFMTRSIRVYILVAISPLICVTYSLDKMKDNKAQAFSRWSKEIANEIFLGPIEGLVYILFIFTAGAIMTSTPLLAIILILIMGRGEEMIQNQLGFQGCRGIRKIGIIPLFMNIMEKTAPPKRGGGGPPKKK